MILDNLILAIVVLGAFWVFTVFAFWLDGKHGGRR